MRILKKEAEGGLTIADWHGGFIGVNKSGNDWRQISAWYESCPCCKGAFDFTFEMLGFELMAYNDGGLCELEVYMEEPEEEVTDTIRPVREVYST